MLQARRRTTISVHSKFKLANSDNLLPFSIILHTFAITDNEAKPYQLTYEANRSILDDSPR